MPVNQTPGDIVQSKRKPPVLVPLHNPMGQRREKIEQRLKLLQNYALSYRELDDIEAREWLNLKHILEHGVERPKGHWFPGMTKREFKPEEVKAAVALLD